MSKTKKVAKWRKSVKALKRVKIKKTRFTTKVINRMRADADTVSLQTFIKIFDNKVKRFIKGEWELEHSLAVLGHLLNNPVAAEKFGYDKETKRK